MAFALAALLPWSSALAQEKYDVGRASITFSSPGWKQLKLDDQGVQYSGEIQGKLPSDTQLFVNATPDKKVLAVMRVRASKGGLSSGYFVYTPKCEDKEAAYAEGNSGFEQSYAQCLLVYPLYSTSSLLKYLSIENETKFKSFAGDVPEQGMRLLSAYYSNANGTFVVVELLLAPQFSGLRTSSDKDDPYLLWGRELMNSVKSSVNSLFGGMKFPAMEFKIEQLG
jgi:hypothetical protein